VFSAIVFHCSTVFPGGRARAAFPSGMVIITIATVMKSVSKILIFMFDSFYRVGPKTFTLF
jgi:hypothetical protein